MTPVKFGYGTLGVEGLHSRQQGALSSQCLLDIESLDTMPKNKTKNKTTDFHVAIIRGSTKEVDL